MSDKNLGPQSLVVHVDRPLNETSAATPPIWQTSTFGASGPEQFMDMATQPRHDHYYGRYGNPTLTQAEAVIAALEETEGAMLTASGMAAITTAVLSFVRSGDHAIAQRTHYASTLTLMNKTLPRFGVECTLVDQTDPGAFERALRPNTKLIHIETPVNPLLQVTDIAAVTDLARSRGIVTTIDNTFASPINQKPATRGVDLVLHSATKYLGGHSDLLAGAIAGRSDHLDEIWDTMLVLGGTLDPFAGWLLLRGLRTLPLRVERANTNGQQIAEFLEGHPAIERVYYPGLPSHPQHELAKRQMRGFGGVVSFEVKGGFDRAEKTVGSLKMALRAASLGGVETLVVHPAAMWAHSLSEEQLRSAGISAGLIRLSLGIEDAADLRDDLDQALAG
jgi:cystathionine beta-lyase/cystathionine gamma-synthase